MWLPGHIVDSMNKVFGNMLRKELIDLMGRSEVLRNRTQSSGSERLSMDSFEGGNRGGTPFSKTTIDEFEFNTV